MPEKLGVEVAPEITQPEPLILSQEQRSDLIIWLNTTLRDPDLKQNYADRLHDMFTKLTGETHDVWESLEGKYSPED